MDGPVTSTVERSVGASSIGEADDRLALMRWVAIVMFVAGGATTALGIEITARTPSSRWAHIWAACAFAMCAAVLLVTRAQRRAVEWAVFASIVVLGLLIARSNPTGMAPLFYLWPSVFAAYFCSPRLAAGVFTWSGVSLGVGLALNDHLDLKVDTFVGVLSSVGLVTAVVSTMTQREAALRDELASMARTDPLTGLLNRRAFDRDVDALTAAEISGHPRALVVFDLDHFKQFNDRHGHLAGDAALRTVANVLRREANDAAVLGRFGGEEFTVLLVDAHLADAIAYVDRVGRRLAASDRGVTRGLTTSAGISVHEPGRSPSELFALADAALYAAKDAGRARFAWSVGGEFAVRICGGGLASDPPARTTER